MGKPVNLNTFRKRKARAEKARKGAQNAVKFGRSKAQKALEESRNEKAARDLDGHERE